jgi:hypothetical protein
MRSMPQVSSSPAMPGRSGTAVRGERIRRRSAHSRHQLMRVTGQVQPGYLTSLPAPRASFRSGFVRGTGFSSTYPWIRLRRNRHPFLARRQTPRGEKTLGSEGDPPHLQQAVTRERFTPVTDQTRAITGPGLSVRALAPRRRVRDRGVARAGGDLRPRAPGWSPCGVSGV